MVANLVIVVVVVVVVVDVGHYIITIVPWFATIMQEYQHLGG